MPNKIMLCYVMLCILEFSGYPDKCQMDDVVGSALHDRNDMPMSQCTILRYVSHQRVAKAQARLRIFAGSLEHLLLAYTKYGCG